MSRSRNNRSKNTAPLLADVESLSHDGRGVARIDGKAVFINGALPGEQVRIAQRQRRRSYSTGELLEVLKPSPHRVDPPCEYFGVCGGCAMQHLARDEQLKSKQQVLMDSFTHIGKIEPEEILQPIYGSAWNYRRKARLGIRYVPKKGGVLVGFRERHNSYITSLSECKILVESVSSLLPKLHQLVESLSIKERVPQIEVAQGDNVTALVFRHLEPLSNNDLRLLTEFAKNNDILLQLQPDNLQSIHSLYPEKMNELFYELAPYGIKIYFRSSDFIQINAETNQLTVAKAIELLELDDKDRVLDLFCGVGNFSLTVAKLAGEVVGIEGDSSLVDQARVNAQRNGITNCTFACANLYTEDTESLVNVLNHKFDKVLLDPPRTGAIEIVKKIPEYNPKKILYVSCNPATLARDSEVLVKQHGYRLVCAGIIDMFPNTAHVESIALFIAP